MKPIEALRTPDARFQRLRDYEYDPHYVDSLPGYEGLRAHYLDLGPKDAERTFLCLHGNSTWHRKMIPVMLESGGRVIAPDLFGFGRSDKPGHDSAYTFHFHRNFLLRFVEHVAARNITLVVQDWGAILGLTLPVDVGFRSKLDRLFVMNTILPVGKPLGPHFYEWRSQVRKMPDLPVGEVIRSITPQLTDQEMAAFSATWRRRVVTHAQERQQKLRPSFLRIACRDRGPRIDPFRTIHRLLPVGPSSGNDRAKAHRRIGEYRSSWIASEWMPRSVGLGANGVAGEKGCYQQESQADRKGTFQLAARRGWKLAAAPLNGVSRE